MRKPKKQKRKIDAAPSASLDLRVALNVILDQVMIQLKANAANTATAMGAGSKRLSPVDRIVIVSPRVSSNVSSNGRALPGKTDRDGARRADPDCGSGGASYGK